MAYLWKGDVASPPCSKDSAALGGLWLAGLLLCRCSPAQPPARKGPSLDSALVGKWDLREVRSRVWKPTFVPRYASGIRFTRHGKFGFSDGCSSITGRFEAWDGRWRAFDVFTTHVVCRGYDALDYRDVTAYEVRETQLLLFTPTQVYVLDRFPYSLLSESSWRLERIVDPRTVRNFYVGRFGAQDEMVLEVERDRVFRFRDIDGAVYSGTLRVRGARIEDVTPDEALRARLDEAAPFDPLPDNTSYRSPEEWIVPTAVVQEVFWRELESYRVVQGTLNVMGRDVELDLLELVTPARLYRFSR